MRTSPRTKSPNLWDNSPANTSLNVPNSSTHWNNQYAHRPSTVRKPPPTGGILPQAGLPTSIIPHRAEENTLCE